VRANAESERPHHATAAPIDGSTRFLMRPIRLLILLLALTVALVLALVRPLQGRATRVAKKAGAHPVRFEPLRNRHLFSHPPAAPLHTFGHRVVSYARHFLGVHYSWGGTSPRTGFDCSGLVRFVYGHFGIVLPHSSFGDLGLGRRVSRHWLRPGDIVFFAGASHVGIYVGSGRFIDAPHTGAVVRISTMGSYGYYAARRFRRG
jgi:cell wall-associated NlpC family hydrolase